MPDWNTTDPRDPMKDDLIEFTELSTGRGPVERAEAVAAEADELVSTKPLSPWADTWRRLKRNKLALVGLVIITIFIVVGVAEEIAYLAHVNLAPYPPNHVDYTQLTPEGYPAPPSLKHPFGTDDFGRDVFSRTLVATRVSLLVGVIAVAIAVAIGLSLGPVSGYYGGKVDSVIMRIADVFFAYPYILFVLLIMTVLGPGFRNVFIAIGILSWATFARLNRGSVLSVRAMEFVEAARAQGASDLRVIFRHVLPNTMAPVYVAIAMGVGGAIVTEAALSYLGIGTRPPNASWGKMIADYYSMLWAGYWWMMTFPSIFLVATVFGFISFGNGLRDATDPKLKE
jgi:ABC-type dipeptide/oligopeptide/nickel transport system permease subunit